MMTAHMFVPVLCNLLIPAVMLGGCLEPALVLLRLCVQASLPEAPAGSFCSSNYERNNELMNINGLPNSRQRNCN